MTPKELQYLIFELLYEKLQGSQENPKVFVGVQGDNLIVMQKDGLSLGVVIVPANAPTPA